MANDYKVWEVSYRYKMGPFEEPEYTERKKYLIIEDTEQKALGKANILFSKDQPSIPLHSAFKTAKPYKKTIPKPKLALLSDVEEFSLEAKLSDDKNSIKYLVKKK